MEDEKVKERGTSQTETSLWVLGNEIRRRESDFIITHMEEKNDKSTKMES
jgi:hypothetical protein